MIKKRYLFLIMLVFLFSISSVNAEEIDNSTDIISNDLNLEILSEYGNNEMLTDSVSTFEKLQDEINNTEINGILNLTKDYKYVSGSIEGIEISKPLTINGNGFTIDGNNESRIFLINHENVTLKNIEFINGLSDKGGAIYSESKNLNIINCNFNNCSSRTWENEYGGGAICLFGDVIKIINCSFVNCSCKLGSSAIYLGSNNSSIINCSIINCFSSFDAGAIIVEGTNAFITNSSFINNIALDASAISWSGDNGIIDNCNFINNTADVEIGTIFSYNKNLKITNCNFINNTAGSKGGAIYSYTKNLNITNCNFINNTAGSEGGAIYSYTKNLNITNCNFINNTDSTIYFGDIKGDAIAIKDGNTKIDNSTFYMPNYISLKSFIGVYTGEAIISNCIFNTTANNCLRSRGNVNLINNTEFTPAFNGYSIYNMGNLKLDGNKFNNSIYNTEGTILNNLTIIVLDNSSIISDGNYLTIFSSVKNGDGNTIVFYELSFRLNDGTPKSSYQNSTNNLLKIQNIEFGTYIVTADFEGDPHYNKEIKTGTLIIRKTNYEIYNNDNILIGDYFEVYLPTNATGNVTLQVNNKNYTSNIINDTALFNSSQFQIGENEIVIYYSGDSVYAPKSLETKINVLEKFNLVANNLTKYYGGSERFTISLRDSDNNPINNAEIEINVNGQTYTRTTDEKGIASMAINLNSGIYNVTTKYESCEFSSTITIKSTVSGANITKIFRNGTQYYATFYDTSGNTLANNAGIEFNINGVFYTRYTNENGVARMNINLNPGEYVITAKNPNSTEMYTNIITVLPSIVENHDVTMYYKNGSRYQVRILGDEGKPVGAGVKVTFNINGVFYDRNTDASGYAGLNINLNPGIYTITAEYNGLRASNTINIKTILLANDLNMKFRDGSKFEVTLLDGQGKHYTNQEVTFNINGVFYTRVTDENGIARLNINLQAGEYVITSSFNGLNAANNIRIAFNPIYYTIGNNPIASDEIIYEIGLDCNCRLITDIYGNTGMQSEVEVVNGITYWCYYKATDWMYLFSPEGNLVDDWNVQEHYR